MRIAFYVLGVASVLGPIAPTSRQHSIDEHAETIALIRSGEVSDAIEVLGKAVERGSKDGAVLRSLFLLLATESRWGEAREIAVRLAAGAESKLETAALERFAAAIHEIQQATHTEELFELVATHRLRGEPGKMIPALHRLLELDPGNRAFHFALGEIHGSQGTCFDREKALTAFRQFLGLAHVGSKDRPPISLHPDESVLPTIERLCGQGVDPEERRELRLYARKFIAALEAKQPVYIIVDAKWTLAQLDRLGRDIDRLQGQMDLAQRVVRNPTPFEPASRQAEAQRNYDKFKAKQDELKREAEHFQGMLDRLKRDR